MSRLPSVAITGFGIELPGLAEPGQLLTLNAPLAPEPFDPAQKLGSRGLRYKDRATKLALCAVKNALAHAGLPEQMTDQAATTGVIVSCSLGNLDSIHESMHTLLTGSTRELSPMSLPNLSSNIIASTIAIRFACRAINLSLCNGATSGIEALYLAMNTIRAQRARRVLVIGVEPRNDVVQQIMTDSARQSNAAMDATQIQLGEGAACLILEALPDALERNATIYGTLSNYRYIARGQDPKAHLAAALSELTIPPELWLVPHLAWPEAKVVADQLCELYPDTERSTLDLCATLGELYSALGVFQAVAASVWLQQATLDNPAQTHAAVAVAGGSWGDGLASMCIRSMADTDISV